ncbi:MAG: hypothetical protein ACKVVP_15220 [Chloroflexota bacterium]
MIHRANGTMNLFEFAQSSASGVTEEQIMSWRGALEAAGNGTFFLRNLDADVCLTLSESGCQALEALLGFVAAQLGSSNALDDLSAELTARAGTYLCQARSVEQSSPTDAVSQVRSLESVLRHLVSPESLATANVIPEATGNADDNDSRRDFANDYLENTANRSTVLMADAPVRGRLPLVFAMPVVDHKNQITADTTTVRICQRIGIPEIADDLCVLDFLQTRVGEAHLPTAFDAFTHEYFWAPEADAQWGHTRDLVDGGSVGVREGVVREFPARLIDTMNLIKKTPSQDHP